MFQLPGHLINSVSSIFMKVFQANMLVAKFNSEIVKAPLKKQQQTFICFLFLTFLSSAAMIFLTQM